MSTSCCYSGAVVDRPNVAEERNTIGIGTGKKASVRRTMELCAFSNLNKSLVICKMQLQWRSVRGTCIAFISAAKCECTTMHLHRHGVRTPARARAHPLRKQFWKHRFLYLAFDLHAACFYQAEDTADSLPPSRTLSPSLTPSVELMFARIFPNWMQVHVRIATLHKLLLI